MATLISLEEIEIKDNNDIQHVITRLMYRKERFTRMGISEEIKTFLINKGVRECIINSFFLNDIIIDTIDYLVDKDDFLPYGDYFVRNPEKIPTYKGTNPDNRFEGEVVGLVPLEKIEIKDNNDIQRVITRIIYKKSEFTYEEITDEIKNFLLQKGVRDAVINSFKTNNMIKYTLEVLIDDGEFLNYNNTYIRNPEKLPTYDEQIGNIVERQGDFCKIKQLSNI